MSQSIWAILYDVAADDQARYLAWFHDVHIPDKLARPGYTWAAHYHTAEAQQAGYSRYLALFGGETTRVFFDPSPAQIKPRQDELTREMMGYRHRSNMLILAEEWRETPTGAAAADPVTSACVRFSAVNALNGADEGYAAWCAQAYFAELLQAEGCETLRKLLAAAGSARHVLLEEFASRQECEAAPRAALTAAWRTELAPSLQEPMGAPCTMNRLWPPLEESAS